MMKDLTPEEEVISLAGRSALEAVLLFHSASPWNTAKRNEWRKCAELTIGVPLPPRYAEATTKNLCNMVRAALGRLDAAKEGV